MLLLFFIRLISCPLVTFEIQNLWIPWWLTRIVKILKTFKHPIFFSDRRFCLFFFLRFSLDNFLSSIFLEVIWELLLSWIWIRFLIQETWRFVYSIICLILFLSLLLMLMFFLYKFWRIRYLSLHGTTRVSSIRIFTLMNLLMIKLIYYVTSTVLFFPLL